MMAMVNTIAAEKLKEVFFYFLYSNDDKKCKYMRYVSGSTVKLVGDDVFVHYKGHLIIKAIYQGINESSGQKDYNVTVRLKDRPAADRILAIIETLEWINDIVLEISQGSVNVIHDDASKTVIDRHHFYSKSDFAALTV